MLEVILLKQLHIEERLLYSLKSASSEEDLPSAARIYLNENAKSQYKIAKYIGKHRQLPVICESFAPEMFESKAKIAEINLAFPQGLPPSFEQLNFKQKKILVIYQGYGYAIINKMIDQAYSDHPYVIEMVLQGKLQEESDDTKREYLTLTQALTIAQKAKSDKVIIIYGASHKFKDVIDQCFKDRIKLKTINMFDLKIAHGIIQDIQSRRPSILNCTHLSLTYPGLSSPLNTNAPSLPTPSSNNTDFSGMKEVGGLLALATFFGFCLFKSCKRKPKKEPTANETISVSKKNQ